LSGFYCVTPSMGKRLTCFVGCQSLYLFSKIKTYFCAVYIHICKNITRGITIQKSVHLKINMKNDLEAINHIVVAVER
jgi:hypothetical protein